MGTVRTVEELKRTALIYWPDEIAQKEKKASVIPLLLETQDSFISILTFADKTHSSWIKALDLSDSLYPNLFLKHLCVITDIGGESLKRFHTELPPLFKDTPLTFEFKNNIIEIPMTSLFKGKKWSNVSLGLEGRKIYYKRNPDKDIIEVCYLLIFGSLAIQPELPIDIKEKCIIGEYLGDKEELENYIKQRYIWVSRQTGGAKANSLGYLIQDYLLEILKKDLPDWDFSKKYIEGIYERTTGGEEKLAKFDIVAKSPSGICWAIESSFQFTTNSTIERKAGQAPSRKRELNRKGHKMAYVIDGSGNFERCSALQSIIESSDCTVNFSKESIANLVKLMKISG